MRQTSALKRFDNFTDFQATRPPATFRPMRNAVPFSARYAGPFPARYSVTGRAGKRMYSTGSREPVSAVSPPEIRIVCSRPMLVWTVRKESFAVMVYPSGRCAPVLLREAYHAANLPCKRAGYTPLEHPPVTDVRGSDLRKYPEVTGYSDHPQTSCVRAHARLRARARV